MYHNMYIYSTSSPLHPIFKQEKRTSWTRLHACRTLPIKGRSRLNGSYVSSVEGPRLGWTPAGFAEKKHKSCCFNTCSRWKHIWMDAIVTFFVFSCFFVENPFPEFFCWDVGFWASGLVERLENCTVISLPRCLRGFLWSNPPQGGQGYPFR